MAGNSRSQVGGPTHPEAEARIWYPGIEALRALAAVAVVIDHSWALANNSFSYGFGIIPGLGNWGVDLFFLLSGYLLADFFWSTPHRTTREFYVRRFFRIAPAYYVCIGILALFFAQHALLFSQAGLKQLLALLTFTQWLWPTTSTNLNANGSLWTLTIEMILYLTLPLLAWLISKRPVLASLGLTGLGVGYRLIIVFHGQWLQQWRFPPGFDSGLARLYLSRQFIGLLPIFVLGIALRWASMRGYLDGVTRHAQLANSAPQLLRALRPPRSQPDLLCGASRPARRTRTGSSSPSSTMGSAYLQYPHCCTRRVRCPLPCLVTWSLLFGWENEAMAFISGTSRSS